LPPIPTPGVPSSGSTWPKFRANLQNTGTVHDIPVSTNGQILWVFPPVGLPEALKKPFIASPVINQDGSLIYIGSADGTLYALYTGSLPAIPATPGPTPTCVVAPVPTPGTRNTCFNLTTTQPITSTAVAAVRNGNDAIFVGGGDALVYGVDQTGGAQGNHWPFPFSGFLSASPTMNLNDGTVYVGSESGAFAGVCPNGIARFGVSTMSIASSAAIGADETVYVGADDQQLRSVQKNGVLNWAFSASAPIFAAPVVEVEDGTTVAIYVADRGGHVYKVDINGQPCGVSGSQCAPFNFVVSAMLSIAADAGDDMLSLDDAGAFPATGTLQASSQKVGYTKQPDTDTLMLESPLETSLPAGAPITLVVGPIRSSPALTANRLYFGSDDGNLYACDKDTGAVVWTTSTGDSIVSSPAVAINGSHTIVVVGSTDGKLYFIDDDNTPTPPTTVIQLSGPIESSPAIGADGTVYIGTDAGDVYAIR